MTTPGSSSAEVNLTQQAGPNTKIHGCRTAPKLFRAVDLEQARSILYAEGVSSLVCLPLESLWESLPLNNAILVKVNIYKKHLIQGNLLSDEGKWHQTIRKEHFTRRT